MNFPRTGRLLLLLAGPFLLSHCAHSTPTPGPPTPNRRLASAVSICHEMFRALFHDISRTANTTTLRKELKVVVQKPVSDKFLAEVGRILEQGPSGFTIALRDVVLDPNVYAITHTDYLPPFVGMKDGKKVFKAQLRLRRYLLVPNGTKVVDVTDPRAHTNVRLTDTEGNFVRLEFKVGHPEVGPDGELREMEAVVDKPALVIDRDDVDLLSSSPENFRLHRDAIAARTKALTITKRGKKGFVNVAEEVDVIMDRIGRLHAEGYTQELEPEMNVSYARTGYFITFPYPTSMLPPGYEGPPRTFEVQITVDKQVSIHDFDNGAKFTLRPDDRVVEMKIPVDFAGKTFEELEQLGLLELAQIRKTYTELPPREGTQPGRGKRRQIPSEPPPSPR